jgi:methylase of polypeptide subunit release factors
LQKNRYLILFSSEFSKDEVVELFEKHHFSNISEIDLGEKKMFMLKKWFII